MVGVTPFLYSIEWNKMNRKLDLERHETVVLECCRLMIGCLTLH
jgi:hypothetical protein